MRPVEAGRLSNACCGIRDRAQSSPHYALDRRRNFPLAPCKRLFDLLRAAPGNSSERAARDYADYSVFIVQPFQELRKEALRLCGNGGTHSSECIGQAPADICRIVPHSLLQALQNSNEPSSVSFRKPRQRGRCASAHSPVLVIKHAYQFGKSPGVRHNRAHHLRGPEFRKGSYGLLPASGDALSS